MSNNAGNKSNKINKSPYIISLQETNKNSEKYYLNKNTNNTTNNTTNNKDNDLSPMSGSEPEFKPDKWNNGNHIQDNHNCYAYVLNTISPTRKGKPQPGYFSGFPQLGTSDYNCGEFYKRLKKDIPSLYLTSFDGKCKKGYYKGFIAIDPKIEDQDYHFYRQDNTGYWSHKPGRQEAIDYDANGKKIKNPLKANRKYKYFNYSTPCFFFCFNNKLSRSSSDSI